LKQENSMHFHEHDKALIKKFILVHDGYLQNFLWKTGRKVGLVHCWRKWRKLETLT